MALIANWALKKILVNNLMLTFFNFNLQISNFSLHKFEFFFLFSPLS